MKATCWEGKRTVRVEEVPDPTIIDSRDAILRVTSTAICGSDLHLYNGFVPPWSAATSWAMSSWARWWRPALE